MPQLEVSAEEHALIEQARSAKAKAAIAAAYDTTAEEETELEATPPPGPSVAGSAGRVSPEPGATPKKHHEFLVEQAREYGFSDHDIESMSEETLVSQIRGARQYAMREQQLANQRQDARAVEAIRPKPPPPPEPTQSAEDAEILADLGIDPTKWDADYCKLEIRKERRRRKDMEDLRGLVQQTQQTAQQVQARNEDELIDRWFDTMGRDREFGKGPSASLKGAPTYDRRVAVYAQMMRLGGLSEKNFQAAVEILYGKARAKSPAGQAAVPANGAPDTSVLAAGAAAPARGPTRRAAPQAPTEEDYEAGQVARPTNRRGAAEVKGDKRAERAIADKMREMGINPDDDDVGDAYDGFLG
jgi:hypothetical protein